MWDGFTFVVRLVHSPVNLFVTQEMSHKLCNFGLGFSEASPKDNTVAQFSKLVEVQGPVWKTGLRKLRVWNLTHGRFLQVTSCGE